MRGWAKYDFLSVKDMQEWILLLQKLVQDLENSKFLLLCKNDPPNAELVCDSDSSIRGINANTQKARIFIQVSQCL